MILMKESGQICNRCGQFTKKFIRCECCKISTCGQCSANEHHCIECHLFINQKKEVELYLEDKYANAV